MTERTNFADLVQRSARDLGDQIAVWPEGAMRGVTPPQRMTLQELLAGVEIDTEAWDILTRPAARWRGAFALSTQYLPDDLVSWNDGSTTRYFEHTAAGSYASGNPSTHGTFRELTTVETLAVTVVRILHRVPAANPGGNLVWKTNSGGTPGWRPDADQVITDTTLYRGAWAAGTAYQVSQIVSYSGDLYICTAARDSTHTDNPTVDTASWGELGAESVAITDTTLYKGDWSAGVYGVGDIVLHASDLYICTVARDADDTDNPATDTASWAPIGGEDGEDGVTWTVGSAFAGSPATGDLHLFPEAVASGLTWVDTDGSSALTAAAAGDFARYNGTQWVRQGSLRGPAADAFNGVPRAGAARNADVLLLARGNVRRTVTVQQVIDLVTDTDTTLYKGSWSAGVYGVGDIVLHASDLYICTVARDADDTDNPATDTASWDRIGAEPSATDTTLYKGDWSAGVYGVGDIVLHAGDLYICTVARAADDTDNPATDTASWDPIGAEGAAITDTTLYRGAWSARVYAIGDVTRSDGDLWICIVARAATDNLPPERDAVGWQQLGAEAAWEALHLPAARWRGTYATGVLYSADDIVEYNGVYWEARIAFTYTSGNPQTIGPNAWRRLTNAERLAVQAARILHRVPAAGPGADQVWRTDADGVPGWRADATIYRGAWAAGTYAVGQIVRHAGVFYICAAARQATDTDDPATDTASWVSFVDSTLYRGAWAAGVYTVSQIVLHAGHLYICAAAREATDTATPAADSAWVEIGARHAGEIFIHARGGLDRGVRLRRAGTGPDWQIATEAITDGSQPGFRIVGAASTANYLDIRLPPVLGVGAVPGRGLLYEGVASEARPAVRAYAYLPLHSPQSGLLVQAHAAGPAANGWRVEVRRKRGGAVTAEIPATGHLRIDIPPTATMQQVRTVVDAARPDGVSQQQFVGAYWGIIVDSDLAGEVWDMETVLTGGLADAGNGPSRRWAELRAGTDIEVAVWGVTTSTTLSEIREALEAIPLLRDAPFLGQVEVGGDETDTVAAAEIAAIKNFSGGANPTPPSVSEDATERIVTVRWHDWHRVSHLVAAAAGAVEADLWGDGADGDYLEAAGWTGAFGKPRTQQGARMESLALAPTPDDVSYRAPTRTSTDDAARGRWDRAPFDASAEVEVLYGDGPPEMMLRRRGLADDQVLLGPGVYHVDITATIRSPSPDDAAWDNRRMQPMFRIMGPGPEQLAVSSVKYMRWGSIGGDGFTAAYFMTLALRAWTAISLHAGSGPGYLSRNQQAHFSGWHFNIVSGAARFLRAG